ncbi:MAG: S-adenosylmethionine:tRNA ribosyltransferase-isomerase [Pseudonocardiales bacterium]|nr:S-adenosylmethionine:tRNA ribosyltransferase-isomerase [Pseudonocardiales bacterium]
MRALETAARPDGGIRLAARIVTGLVTGLHVPEASHLLLLEAVAGAELVGAAYAPAVERRYLWHEVGDSTLFLPDLA